MERDTVLKVTHYVAKRFPEMKSIRPSIRRQTTPTSKDPRFLLTYKGNATLPNGKTIKRIVRVVTDQKGRVFKLSTSR